jgi:hypothetical protein
VVDELHRPFLLLLHVPLVRVGVGFGALRMVLGVRAVMGVVVVCVRRVRAVMGMVVVSLRRVVRAVMGVGGVHGGGGSVAFCA